MTPQERQLVDDLFDRLANVENAPRDPDALAAIAEGLRKAPNAIYALVQTVLLQDEALKRANHHIEELEAAQAPPQQQQPGGFLDSMRGSLFGQDSQSRGSVPNVRPPESRPVWNTGQVMQGQPAGYEHPPYGGPQGQPYGSPPFGGGGGSFLGTAAAAAAGMVGGSLLLNGIRSMMGGSHQSFADPGTSNRAASPWSDESNSNLARDAGVNDIGSSRDRADDSSRSNLLDQSSDDHMSNDDQLVDYADNDQDDMDMDSDDFGNDDGGDYA
jgi:hypothetical protein